MLGTSEYDATPQECNNAVCANWFQQKLKKYINISKTRYEREKGREGRKKYTM